MIVLFCSMSPLRGICNCNDCPRTSSVDAQFINTSLLTSTCLNSDCCCPHSEKDNDFDFCTCICTNSPKPFSNNLNQILKLKPKDQFPNSFAPHIDQLILPVVTPILATNTKISDYSEFYNSPRARSTSRIHSILNIWQI
ncbi:MAG: hypothetical protein LBH59_02325 [Planctomycetaceae bacterium]|nr:hypothetical protein [Planctomycetaceae bacterium]